MISAALNGFASSVVALYAFFKRKRSLFLEHALFSLHFLSFALLSTVALLLPALWVLQLGQQTAISPESQKIAQ